MAEPPGILCQLRNPVNINDGTSCAQKTPKPGITGERLLDRAWDSVSWASREIWAGTQWVEDELWAGTKWAGGELWAGTKWAASEVWSGAEWAGVEIATGVNSSWGEIRGGLVWLGHKLYDAHKYLLTLFHKINNAANWDILKAIAEPILGATFMEAGVLWGIVESLGRDVLSLLELGKMVVLASCYELMMHPQLVTAFALNPAMMPAVLTALALGAAAHQIPGLVAELKKADDQLKKMLKELLGIVKEPAGFVKALGRQIKQETLGDFNKLKYYATHLTLENEFEAGKIYGRVLYQVVMLILLVLSVAGAAAKLMARVPWLLRAARILKTGGEVEELIETDKVIQGTKTAEEVGEAQKVPKKRAQTEKPPGGETRDWKYQPKQTGRAEPGSVPETQELLNQMEIARKRTAPQASDGWPQMSDKVAQTFGSDPQPVSLKPGTKLYRVIDSDGGASGSYWSLDPPPQTEGAWRARSAVQDGWNGDGGYVESTVPDAGLKAWEGPAAPQPSSMDGSLLPGGQTQIWVPRGTIAPGSPPQPTPWNH